MGSRLLLRLRQLDDRVASSTKALWQRAFPERVDDEHGAWPLTLPEAIPTPERPFNVCARCGKPGALQWAAMGGNDLWDGWACTVCPHRWAVRAVA